ncbi:MAG TPA: hypothetical protein VI056_12730, partial [Candidatus Limnocylindria bacterium]
DHPSATLSVMMTGFGLRLDPDLCWENLRRLSKDAADRAMLQSCLRRTLDDVAALAHLQPRVRVVKGIWHEPESVAYLDAPTIRRNYLAILGALIACGGYPEVATHDVWLIEHSLGLLAGLSPAQYEFQMLLGYIARDAPSQLFATAR